LHERVTPSGVTVKELDMTTLTTTQTTAKTGLMSIVMVALTGAVLVYFAGFANAQVLHDAAHDTRHSTGFPCH